MPSPSLRSLSLWLCLVGVASPAAAQTAAPVGASGELIAHWPLAGDALDISGRAHHATNHGVDLAAADPAGGSGPVARFDGLGSYLQISAHADFDWGKQDFSILADVYADDPEDLPGDLVTQYDPHTRRGWLLTLKSNSGVTFSQANRRQLQFGIDDNRPLTWTACGRPGTAILAFALAVHDGQLYAGTCHPGAEESGRVYRYLGGKDWDDCGAPAACNSVTSFAVHDGQLYAGTGKYRLAGSALSESPNPHDGGQIFRYDGKQQWTLCGQLPNRQAVGGLVVFGGKLYASSLYPPAGFFRYDGETQWTDCGVPNGKRVEALGVFRGALYATSYDGGRVFRFDGSTWTDCGQLGSPEENTQTYSLAIFQGGLHVGTWRSGRVYRFEDIGRWTDVGQLGSELEVMGMLVHNGRFLAGTLPSAEVYQYQGGTSWDRVGELDQTPDVKYRRAWTMAEYQGRLFCSTLPSGQIYSCRAGNLTTWDQPFPAGWHRVAAVKRGEELRLYVDERLVATSKTDPGEVWNLTCGQPLRLGFGPNHYFRGCLRDVRLYRSP